MQSLIKSLLAATHVLTTIIARFFAMQLPIVLLAAVAALVPRVTAISEKRSIYRISPEAWSQLLADPTTGFQLYDTSSSPLLDNLSLQVAVPSDAFTYESATKTVKSLPSKPEQLSKAQNMAIVVVAEGLDSAMGKGQVPCEALNTMDIVADCARSIRARFPVRFVAATVTILLAALWSWAVGSVSGLKCCGLLLGLVSLQVSSLTGFTPATAQRVFT